MSQRELAQHVGVSKAAVSLYVTGDRRPKVRTAQRIAEALGVTFDELFGGAR